MTDRWLLVAEDNDDDFAMVERAIRRVARELRIVRAHDGLEAVDRLSRMSDLPFLAFFDLRMPRLTGIEALERLGAEACRMRVPAVILSSSDEPRDIEAAYRAGARAYLRKPVDYEEFLEVVGAAVRFWLLVAKRPSASPAMVL